MEELAASCVLTAGEYVGELTVVVPLDVFDMTVTENVGHSIDEIISYVLSCQVKNQLISALRGGVKIRCNRPVRMSTVQIAVGRDHFRLDPKTEL